VQWPYACVIVIVAITKLVGAPPSAIRLDEFFVHPEVLCKALEQYGIHPNPWAPIGQGPHPASTPFDCEYRGAPEDENHTTVFRVSGDYAQRADILSLAVSVGAPSEWPAAQQEFLRLVSGLFNAIDKPPPAGLLRAIKGRRYYLRRSPYGVLWFNFIAPMEPSQRRTFWFRLSQGSVPVNR
jgi:hypothetical protein